MPYSSWKDAPPHVKKRGKQAAERWVAAWNGAFEKYNDEQKAFAIANSVIAARVPEGATWSAQASDVFADWDPAGKYSVEYIRSGYWEDFNGQGEVFVTNADLADAVEAFDSWKAMEGWATDKRRPFLDYNHGITRPKMSHRPNEAAGWMVDAWIEDMDGKRVTVADARTREDVLRIRAVYEVTADANEDIKQKRFGLFSPTFVPSGVNEATGEAWKFQIVGGALTNIPFFEGLEAFSPMMASGRAARAFALGATTARADSCLTIRCPVEISDLESKLAALEKLGFEIESFYQGPRPYAMAQRGSATEEKSAEAGGGKADSEGSGIYEIECASAAVEHEVVRAAIALE